MLSTSKTWSLISKIIENQHNNLSNVVLSEITSLLLKRYKLILCNGTEKYTLLNNANYCLYIQIKKFDYPITDYNRVVENGDYYYIQQVFEQKDLSNKSLQIKIHKSFFKLFCY